MYKVIGDTIEVTRGDTLLVHLNLKDSTGATYVPAENDIIKFKLKNLYEKNVKITKTLDNYIMNIELSSEETSKLDTGTYVYDIEITFENGDVNTPINYANFIVRSDV